jgi:hypothetical protein
MKRKKRQLATLDFETDPFERGGDPVRPFVWGFVGPNGFDHYWGDDCVARLMAFLDGQDAPLLIYAHNGGKFDFLFLLQEMAQEVKVINGRIVSCRIGIHELRDSYAILPVKLADMGGKDGKLDIDYMKMKEAVRHRHRKEIIHYLKRDCDTLYREVVKYVDRFGVKLTMAGAAMAKLLEAMEDDTQHSAGYTFQRLTRDQDKQFRPFYFGGRVECFERGEIVDDLISVDRNSMYPAEMAACDHPTGNQFLRQTAIDDRTDFVLVDATSAGAFPLRAADNRLTFPHGRAIYRVTGHEVRAAMALGKVDISKLIWAAYSPLRMNFAPFVHPFYDLRVEASDAGDESAKLHYKLVLNSSYGRWALNPDRLKEWAIVRHGLLPDPDSIEYGQEIYDPERPWQPAFTGDDVVFWRRSITEDEKKRSIMNVATGASITGASRARLFEAICTAERPVYCDTDSITARSVDVPMDDGGGKLGDWKIEAKTTHAYIAGKKLYALADAGQDADAKAVESGKYATVDGRRVPVLKMASKGVRLTGDEIAAVARGETVTWEAQTPSITIAGIQTYMKREIRRRD